MISVIIAAAGNGTRMGLKEKKQFIELVGIPILIRTTLKFYNHSKIDEIVIVTNKDEVERVEKLLVSYDIRAKVVAGGTRRQDSIYNALQAVSGKFVLVQDAARPFVTAKMIDDNLETIKNTHGVITGVPAKDTIKVVSDGKVMKTLNRSELFNVQTPQTFRYDDLVKAYNYMKVNNLEVTDDSSLFEVLGYEVLTVNGSYDNIKITTTEDLLIAEMILRREQCE